MALADPQTVTVSGVAKTCARTGLALKEGTFMTSDGEFTMVVKHDSTKRNRHIVKVQRTLLVADPLFPSQNTSISYSAALNIDHPKNGAAAADVIALAKALVAWATDPNITKIVGSES